MRYFDVALKTNSEQIEKNAKSKLKGYGYDNPIAAVNAYMYRHMRNGLCYIAYREEEGITLAAFAYDEKKESFDEAYGCIFEMLGENFHIKKAKADPCEITMYQFYECLCEGRRREYVYNWSKVADDAKVTRYYEVEKEKISSRYDLKEKIISENPRKVNPMYHESVIKELSNIGEHKNTSGFQGNMVHYVISARSTEAASDITEALMQKLTDANRLSGRRMEIISEIVPELYEGNHYLEEFIENNHGGVVVIDLSEKLGQDPTDYGMTCIYIDSIVKRYKKDCLFVFTYNTEKPGFAYTLLPLLQKHILAVELKEGKGDRKAAVSYMKELIKTSEYSKYAGQANEFMKLFPGNEFTQTDVLIAFEQFESWCLNKNVLKAYNYSFSDTVMLDRDEDTKSSYDKLQKLIGLTKVKEQIEHIIATDVVEKERKKRKGNAYDSGTMHMIFGGNPGTAKTTVAKLFAGIAREKGILKSGAFVECGGMDLDGLGCVTAIRRAFIAAKGGVLFIDEAYSLKSDVAITALIQEMENRREDVIVILAGYHECMQEFLERNDGLKSRIPHWIDFPDYSAEELTEIFELLVKERGFAVTKGAVREAHNVFEKVRYMDNFGNGRYVRNLLERAIQNQSLRLLDAKGNAEGIQKKELFLITEADMSMLDERLKADRKCGTAQKELNEMIGLSSVKEVIGKMVASLKLNKARTEKGICNERPSLHMVFTGNPGTAKTTVARLFAEIMKDEKVLPSGNFVETGRADLVSDHVGGTAKLVKRKFKEAQGGVLFIDEAYSLCDSHENGFGDEAINTIVQEMENHREDVTVIFAGYSEPMQSFLDRNPGMASRIAFYVEFEDYSVPELCDITKLMLSKKKLAITDAAMEKLQKIYEGAKKDHSFGNGRFVRKMLEQAEMNLAERIAGLDESELTTKLLTTIEESDIPKPDGKKNIEKKQIGFSVA